MSDCRWPSPFSFVPKVDTKLFPLPTDQLQPSHDQTTYFYSLGERGEAVRLCVAPKTLNIKITYSPRKRGLDLLLYQYLRRHYPSKTKLTSGRRGRKPFRRASRSRPGCCRRGAWPRRARREVMPAAIRWTPATPPGTGMRERGRGGLQGAGQIRRPS